MDLRAWIYQKKAHTSDDTAFIWSWFHNWGNNVAPWMNNEISNANRQMLTLKTQVPSCEEKEVNEKMNKILHVLRSSTKFDPTEEIFIVSNSILGFRYGNVYKAFASPLFSFQTLMESTARTPSLTLNLLEVQTLLGLEGKYLITKCLLQKSPLLPSKARTEEEKGRPVEGERRGKDRGGTREEEGTGGSGCWMFPPFFSKFWKHLHSPRLARKIQLTLYHIPSLACTWLFSYMLMYLYIELADFKSLHY